MLWHVHENAWIYANLCNVNKCHHMCSYVHHLCAITCKQYMKGMYAIYEQDLIFDVKRYMYGHVPLSRNDPSIAFRFRRIITVICVSFLSFRFSSRGIISMFPTCQAQVWNYCESIQQTLKGKTQAVSSLATFNSLLATCKCLAALPMASLWRASAACSNRWVTVGSWAITFRAGFVVIAICCRFAW